MCEYGMDPSLTTVLPLVVMMLPESGAVLRMLPLVVSGTPLMVPPPLMTILPRVARPKSMTWLTLCSSMKSSFTARGVVLDAD